MYDMSVCGSFHNNKSKTARIRSQCSTGEKRSHEGTTQTNTQTMCNSGTRYMLFNICCWWLRIYVITREQLCDVRCYLTWHVSCLMIPSIFIQSQATVICFFTTTDGAMASSWLYTISVLILMEFVISPLCVFSVSKRMEHLWRNPYVMKVILRQTIQLIN